MLLDVGPHAARLYKLLFRINISVDVGYIYVTAQRIQFNVALLFRAKGHPLYHVYVVPRVRSILLSSNKR